MLSSSSRQALLSAIRSNGRRHLVTLTAATSTVQSVKQQWSGSMSFASPESDFCNAAAAAAANVSTQKEQKKEMSTLVWSHSYSFSSPESDFTGTSAMDAALQPAPSSSSTSWSSTLSFASPESDFAASGLSATQEAEDPHYVGQPIFSETLSFASPESDFGMAAAHETEALNLDSQQVFSETLSFASPESDFVGMGYDRREHQRLPHTLAEALMDSHRALVVTTATAPHRIVHVNHAWEDLCCFKRQEVLHRTLRMIQGPESNPQMILSAVDKVLHDKQHHDEDVYVINYKGNGEKFINHLSIGRLFLDKDSAEQGKPEFLVGMLEEVEEDEVPLRLSTAM